ncbi:glycosyltransferase family 9 protein [Streptosporangium sp. NPDC002721]|uniref:glycosyltransferase family 9 protein n=1 Tax=Streptosporangium sp. NPDC002721 TaxID=3366188 RepID=UPI0036BEF4F0
MPEGRNGAGRAGVPELVALRGLGLGDVLTAVPALRALRRAHPGHRIVLAAPAPLAGLVPLIDAVDELLDVSGPGPVPVDRPDTAVNLHGRGPQSIAALRRTRPRRLLTHAHPGFPDAQGPPWRCDIHETVRWCAFLEWYGIAADPADLALPAPPSETTGHVIVHPGAAGPARRWPPERFARVAAALSRTGRRVLVTGSAAERALGRKVAALAGMPEEAVLAGRTDVGALAALVGSARLVVCGDTGVAHLAAAFATPSVVLCGPVAPALWGPPAAGPHLVLWTGRRGDPHGHRPDPGLLEIGVGEVLDAVGALLEVSAR